MIVVGGDRAGIDWIRQLDQDFRRAHGGRGDPRHMSPSTLRGPFNLGASPTYDHPGWLTDLDHYVYRFSNDVFNVKDRDYGATGMELTNDAAAVQAAGCRHQQTLSISRVLRARTRSVHRSR